jgi:hypothetical protein
MKEQPRQKLCTKLLSYGQLKEYLSVLIENALLEYIDGTQKKD